MPKRRYVIGIREVQKLAQKSRIKCVLIAPDIERIQADGLHYSNLVAPSIDCCCFFFFFFFLLAPKVLQVGWTSRCLI